MYFYRSLSEEDLSKNQRKEKKFHSVETQTEDSENSIIINRVGINTESEGHRRILYGTNKEILNIYCKKYFRPPTIQEIKLFSYKRRNYQIAIKKHFSEKFNTLV